MSLTKVKPSNVDDQVFGRRNLIINGDMRVSQRATSVTSQTAGAAVHTVDRFYTELSGATVDIAQVTDAPDGYQYSQKVTMNGALTASASQYVIPFETRVEGNDLQRLSYGTSNAKKLTLSFWIKSSKTGTYTVEFSNNNSGGIRKSSSQYTISSADTWEHKTLTWVGDTTRAFEESNAAELTLFWWMVAGTTFTSGTSQQGNSWDDGTAANRAAGVSGSAADDDYWAMTGVQLEVGDQASPFEFLSYAEQLHLCRRYYQRFNSGSEGSNYRFGIGSGVNPNKLDTMFQFSPQMAKVPSLDAMTAGNYRTNFNSTATSIYIVHATPSGTCVRTEHAANSVEYKGCELLCPSNFSGHDSFNAAYIAFDAEI